MGIMRKNLLTLTVLIGCSSSAQHTSDGGTIYTASDPPAAIACTTDSDCCVFADECHSAAYVVHAGDTVQVSQTGCNLCLVPSVQVWCSGGGLAERLITSTWLRPRLLRQSLRVAPVAGWRGVEGARWRRGDDDRLAPRQ